MKKNSYWSNRSKERMMDYHNGSDVAINDIINSYEKARKNLEKKMMGISKELPNGEFRNVLKENLNERETNKLRKQFNFLVEIESDLIALNEIRTSELLYKDVLSKAFNRSMFDIQKGIGLGFSFDMIPENIIKDILKNPWSGKHFAKRIGINNEILANNITDIMLDGFMEGKSIDKMARELKESVKVGKYIATRLIRTEVTYISNAAELESYKEMEIEKYIYIATLDTRTSDVCQGLDREVFEVSKAMAGENLPPMHPNCRSSIRSYISKEELAKIKRRARDPITGKTYLIPGDMNYKEWYNKYARSD